MLVNNYVNSKHLFTGMVHALHAQAHALYLEFDEWYIQYGITVGKPNWSAVVREEKLSVDKLELEAHLAKEREKWLKRQSDAASPPPAKRVCTQLCTN